MTTTVCENNSTRESVPAQDIIILPDSVQVLPFATTVRVTKNLWRSLIGNNRNFSCDELLGDISTYLTFGLLGLVGFDLERTTTTDSMLLPIICRTDKSVMRLTIHRRLRLITLSMPEEVIPFVR